MDTKLKEIVEHADHLKRLYSARDERMRHMEDMYWMRWDEQSDVTKKIEHIKLTLSPSARTKLKGAIRLLIAADPEWTVPKDINKPSVAAVADKIEKFCKFMWFASGAVTGDPIHYDVVRSALLYDEVVISVNSTQDLVDYATGSPALKERAEYVRDCTPYLFEVLNPQGCYSETGRLGLNAILVVRDVDVAYIKDTFGKLGEKALKSHTHKKELGEYDKITLHSFWDMKKNVIWLDGFETPITFENHGLPCIPIVQQSVSGSKLFTKKEEQIEPFLWTLYKSGLANRQNLILTVLYTMMFTLGANPMFVYTGITPDRELEFDSSKPGLIKLAPGERFEALQKAVIDPSLMQGWQVSQELEEQTTIYSTALGQSLGQYANYSMMSLLYQTGRLSLTEAQRKSSWAIAAAAKLALKMMSYEGEEVAVRYDNEEYILNPADVPSHFEIKANLDVALPQDRLSAANIANILASGDTPLVDKGWVRENILNIGQSEDMTRAIWNEKAAELNYQKYIFTMMAQMAQMKQMALMGEAGMAGGAPGGQPMGGPPMGGQPPMGGPPPMEGPMMPPEEGSPPMVETPPLNAPETPVPPAPPRYVPRMG